jgi:hypothetical protein
MKNLNELEKVIREALPELMELKAGCVIKSNYYGIAPILRYLPEYYDVEYIDYKFMHRSEALRQVTIIGQEIQLIHVLKWLLKKEDKNFDFNLHSNSTSLGIGENNPFGICYNWNLDENLLKNQKQVLIDFLFNLIQK